MDKERYITLAEQYGEDLARIMYAQEMEKQKNKTFAERVNRYGNIAANIDNITKNKNKSNYQQFLDEQNAKKEADKAQQDKKSMLSTLIGSLESHCKNILEDAFYDIEKEIKHNYNVWEFEEFKNYKSLAHKIIMNVVEKEYSPDVLKKHEYKSGNNLL